jgi:hypothetical protein
VACTIGLSILLHCLTANPLVAALANSHDTVPPRHI